VSGLYRHTIKLPSSHSKRLRSLKAVHSLSPSIVIAAALHRYFRNLTDGEIVENVRIDSLVLQRLTKRTRSSRIEDEFTGGKLS
jgi:hypothetical protein